MPWPVSIAKNALHCGSSTLTRLRSKFADALYNIFIKKGSAYIHPILGGVILQFVAAFLGAALLAGIIAFPGDSTKIHIETPGIGWSIGAGVS